MVSGGSTTTVYGSSINAGPSTVAGCAEALSARLAESGLADRSELTDFGSYLTLIEEEAFRCKEITEKLLTFSRGGDRKREATDLAEVIQGVLDVVKHLQNCKGKRIDFQPGVNPSVTNPFPSYIAMNGSRSGELDSLSTKRMNLAQSSHYFSFTTSGGPTTVMNWWR